MPDALPGVFQFLERSVALQNIDDAHKQQQPLAVLRLRWNCAHPETQTSIRSQAH